MSLKIWGKDVDRILQTEDESLKIIDAKEIDFFLWLNLKKPQIFDEVEVSMFEVFANPNCYFQNCNNTYMGVCLSVL